MRVAVIVFPGSNCDVDALRAIDEIDGCTAGAVWHDNNSLEGYDAVVLPGGFSHGDYLRCGAIAQCAPIMQAVRDMAAAGQPVLGICNGFQVLTEAGLLPGALLRNDHLQFRCDIVDVEIGQVDTPFTRAYTRGERLRLPIAHGEGSYVADAATLAELERDDRVVLRYSGDNPNGSLNAIAGICNQQGNVLGMMPHPERAMHSWLGSADGRRVFESMFASWKKENRHALAAGA